MYKILFSLLLSVFCSTSQMVAQTSRRKTTTATVKSKKNTKTTTQAKKTGKKGKAAPTPTNEGIRKLQSEQATLKQKMAESQNQLATTRKDVKAQLATLQMINGQISDQQKVVTGLQVQIDTLNRRISTHEQELRELEADLTECKRRYTRGVLYMYRNRLMQNKLMFIFSADNFRQMYRRLRYTQEYVKYQRVQGQIIAAKEQAVREKRNLLSGERVVQGKLLTQGKAQQTVLEGQQRTQQGVVTDLNQKQAELQATLAQQQRQYNALNAKIEQLIRAEIEAAERRRKAEEARRAAEAEARKKAAEAARKAAEERRRAAEAARKAEAEARRAEAEARRKAAEAERKAEAARKRGEERAAREARAAQAREEARAAEQARAAAAEAQRARTATEEANRATATANQNAPAPSDARLTGSFASNQGRLPMPITGNYTISSHFGAYNVNGLNGVTLDNKGINLTAPAGAQARCVFDGEVTAIFSMGGMTNVIVRHGSYITVYCNLSGVSVRQGQRVSTRQTIGNVARDASGNCTLHFQLRHETQKLNPERWLRR
ncbi:murein hydrolase activator EnvC family protein [Ihuprevotella massiliensis]|uniref:murein hydrolase activator EnvC family protein n=1 Tax=Ihuprevotella massiliensis TaxID=1852368 RepID=UPI00094E50A2